MKDARLLPIKRTQLTHQSPAATAETTTCTDQTDSHCQSQYVAEEGLLNIPSSPFTRVPQDYGESRISRERVERTTLEDKIRRAIDNWTAEERATAYWYLYACGMTLERAKAIRHKGGI